MKKIKISRSFTFKAYKVEVSEELLNDSKKYLEFVNNVKSENINKHCGNFTFKSDCEYYVEVLILIVVEDGLVQFQSMVLAIVSVACLNPYCSGRWSRTVLNVP